MTGSGRYQRQELYLQQGDIRCHRGVDPLTGLAVLIYAFPGRPTAPATGLESENIPGILASSYDGTVGQVVAAFSPHYGLVASGESVVDDHFVLEAVRAARDAATAGVVHGDLRGGRLLYAQGHVLVEGYGVPWKAVDPDATAPEVAGGGPPSLAADVYALAATLLLLGGDNLSHEVGALLRGALAPDPRERTAAVALYAQVRRACGGTMTPPPRSFDELTIPTGTGDGAPAPVPQITEPPEASPSGASLSATRSDFQLDLDFELDVATPLTDHGALTTGTAGREPHPLPPRVPATNRPESAPSDAPDEPEPITLQSDPGLSPHGASRSTRDSTPGFVKDLPPGATYRAGSLDDAQPPAPIRIELTPQKRGRRRSWRGPLLVILALVAAGAVASVAFLNQGTLAPAPRASGTVSYILSVQVQPANLPPVDLYVVRSPSGSGTPAGTILCRAPCKIVLDHAGKWQFRGEFLNRTSAVADVTLPGPRIVTLTFPPGPGSTSTPATRP